MLDVSTFDIRGSPSLSRHRMGSFNSNYDNTESPGELQSPNPTILAIYNQFPFKDHTPNGTLRRRPSREDDAKLMELLRTSGYDESRERRPSSYGSLDRSWARKARSGSGTRKRPQLLNIDFGTDRERASSPSPSPLADSKPLPGEESKPREWRQKIETWLQGTESGDQPNAGEYRRPTSRNSTSNRRTFEKESGLHALLFGTRRISLKLTYFIYNENRNRTQQVGPTARREVPAKQHNQPQTRRPIHPRLSRLETIHPT